MVLALFGWPFFWVAFYPLAFVRGIFTGGLLSGDLFTVHQQTYLLLINSSPSKGCARQTTDAAFTP